MKKILSHINILLDFSLAVMRRSEQFSEYERGIIVGMRLAGCSFGDIGDAVGSSNASVRQVFHRHNSVRKKRGRKEKLSERDIRHMVLQVKRNRKISIDEHSRKSFEEIGTKVSVPTVRRVLRNEGFYSRVATRKPRLSKSQIRKRIEFCDGLNELTDDGLRFWIFSDETRINISESDGRVRVLRRSGEELLPDCIVTTEKFGGGSVSFWGCIGGGNPGVIVQYDTPMTSEKYCQILEENMDEALTNMFGDSDVSFELYQDGASWHTSKKSRVFFEDNEWSVITGPPNSPDLNIIENVWGYLKKKLAMYRSKAGSLCELASRFKFEFENLPKTYLETLTRSFFDRAAAVLKNRGRQTKY